MQRKTIDDEPTYVFQVEDIYGAAGQQTPRGMVISGHDGDGDRRGS